jgi:hypothetical protein
MVNLLSFLFGLDQPRRLKRERWTWSKIILQLKQNRVFNNNWFSSIYAVFLIDNMRKLRKLSKLLKFVGGEPLTQTLLTQLIRWN